MDCESSARDDASRFTAGEASRRRPARPAAKGQVPADLGPGEPIAALDRTPYETFFGRELSDVRVHRGPAATRATHVFGTLAFSSGRHVVISERAGTDGALASHVMAHELSHVVNGIEGIHGFEPTPETPSSTELVAESRPIQFLSDLTASVLGAPAYAPEILGETWDSIKEHWVAFSAVLLGFLAAEAVIAALAGAPEPTTATKWAAFILQSLLLLLAGTAAALELGQVAMWTWEWISIAWDARSDKTKRTAAAKAFCRVLLHAALLVLSVLGVRAKFGAAGAAQKVVAEDAVALEQARNAAETAAAFERARKFGTLLLAEIRNMSSGKMSHLVAKVNEQGFGQEQAVVAVEEASKAFGRTALVSLEDGRIVVSSVMPGESIPVFVIEASGRVLGASARLAVNQETLEVTISNIRPWGS